MDRDWENCMGEVFRIRRTDGRGNVTVGDYVGIQFPRDRKDQWLSCTRDVCRKSRCPGRPSNEHGFASEDLVQRCTGEVFRIYAKGKKEGDHIKSDDDIMLYYVQEDNWLSVGNNYLVKATCPGKSRPPGRNMYDRCASEVFRIVKKL